MKLVTAIEQHWHEHKRFPALGVIGPKVGIEYEKLREYINENEVIRIMLENRGVEIPSSTEHGLTPEQLAAANAILNPFDSRPNAQKLRDLGINPHKISGWAKGNAWKAYFRERSEELMEEGIPLAHRALIDQVGKGNIKAIELFYQVSGRYTGQSSLEMQNVQLMMTRILEAIQMEVGDQEVIRRIGERFQAMMSGQAVASPVGEPVRAEIEDNRERAPSPAQAFMNRMNNE